jgi:replicative DNA helicase
MDAMADVRAAEYATVGALLVDPTRLDGVRAWLHADDFWFPPPGLIYERLCEPAAGGHAAGPEAVLERLREHGELDRDGTAVRELVEMLESVPAVSAVDDYARLVVQGSLLRAVEAAGTRVRQVSASGDVDAVFDIATDERNTVDAARARWRQVAGRPAIGPAGEGVDAPARPGRRDGRPRPAGSAETIVVGSLLLAPREADRIAGWLRPEDFGDRRAGAVYERLQAIVAAGGTADRVTVAAAMGEGRPAGPRSGWARLLAGWEATVPSPVAVTASARRVLEGSLLVAAEQCGARLVGAGRSGRGGADTVLDQACGELSTLVAERTRWHRAHGDAAYSTVSVAAPVELDGPMLEPVLASAARDGQCRAVGD